LTYLSSYLGIERQSLSRIRKYLTQKWFCHICDTFI
jgi:hypothetical protein